MFTLDKEKYKAAFLYMAQSLGKIEGMKKAYKLFYFLDFDYYEAYGKPFTGDVYKSLQMGPVPIYFPSVIGELVEEGKVRINHQRMSPTHEYDTNVYVPLVKVDYAFTNNEKKILDRIIKIYGSQTGKNLENISHSEVPYNAVEVGQIIPYEYAIYRDTPGLVP